MLIDTHAHVNFAAYKDDGEEVIKRALANGVWLVNIGSQWDTSQRAVQYAHKYREGVYASIALHPIHLSDKRIKENVDKDESLEFQARGEAFDYERYRDLAKDEKVVAIGETGLDYYHLKEEELQNQPRLKELQKEVFLKHLELAQELGKPIMIHCREAYNDLIEMLRNWEIGKLKGVVHSFVGRWSQAEQFLEMGLFLGFNGIITFARDYDQVVQNTPLERILTETDCPYLAPIPFRGKRNEPSYVKYVAEKIAELKGVSLDEAAKVTTKNAKKLFNL